MDVHRRNPDHKSPVQPGNTSVVPFIIIAMVGAGAAWTLIHDNGSVSADIPRSVASERQFPPAEHLNTSSGAQSARGSIAGLFSAADYPVDAQMRDEQGTVGVELKIDKHGRVSRCEVVQSSNSASLDGATCRILQRRARFTPAQDDSGEPIEGTYTQRITWRLEG